MWPHLLHIQPRRPPLFVAAVFLRETQRPLSFCYQTYANTTVFRLSSSIQKQHRKEFDVWGGEEKGRIAFFFFFKSVWLMSTNLTKRPKPTNKSWTKGNWQMNQGSIHFSVSQSLLIKWWAKHQPHQSHCCTQTDFDWRHKHGAAGPEYSDRDRQPPLNKVPQNFVFFFQQHLLSSRRQAIW